MNSKTMKRIYLYCGVFQMRYNADVLRSVCVFTYLINRNLVIP